MEGMLLSDKDSRGLSAKFKLENGTCIDNLGHNLVDQVFYEKQVSSLVVEVSETGKDTFLLSQ